MRFILQFEENDAVPESIEEARIWVSNWREHAVKTNRPKDANYWAAMETLLSPKRPGLPTPELRF